MTWRGRAYLKNKRGPSRKPLGISRTRPTRTIDNTAGELSWGVCKAMTRIFHYNSEYRHFFVDFADAFSYNLMRCPPGANRRRRIRWRRKRNRRKPRNLQQ